MSPAQANENPPLPVAIAVWIMGISYLLGLVLFEASTKVTIARPARESVASIVALLIFLLLRAVYRGRQWARVVFIGIQVVAFLGVTTKFAERAPLEMARVIVQVLIEITACVLLILPIANKWFSKKTLE
jgi:hypothetical protein